MSEIILEHEKLPSNWKMPKISDISNLVRGISYKKSDSKKTVNTKTKSIKEK